jgi:hypothetical protein
MTDRSSVALCVLVLGTAAGCAASQAAGSRPSDMTPERHCAAAAQESVRAAEKRRAADNVKAGKLSVENRLRAEHNASARKHERNAEQHKDAALVASGGYIPPCGPSGRSSY